MKHEQIAYTNYVGPAMTYCAAICLTIHSTTQS